MNLSGFLKKDPRTQKLPFVIFKWVVVAPFLVFSTIICGLCIIILSLAGAPDLASRIFGTAWARMNAFISMMKVVVIGAHKVDPSTSYVIVANHQSLADIYVLYGYLGMDIKWVMKQELRQVPILGLCAVLMGHILIDRKNKHSAISSINQSITKITDGMSVIFFPEGTRSRTGELKKFKKGAFRFANEFGLAILPVAIKGTNQVLPSNTLDLMPGTVSLEFCDPIYNTRGQGANALSRQTWDIINHALAEDTSGRKVL